uniref:Uncharacterized protein n=1 Tax=Clytia hemisphaerica TaxID=252671 RepID=A0A7M5X6H1_9CNID
MAFLNAESMFYAHQMKKYQQETHTRHQKLNKTVEKKTENSKKNENVQTSTETTNINDNDSSSRKNSNLLLDKIRELLSKGNSSHKTGDYSNGQENEDNKFQFNPLILVASFLAFLSSIFNKKKDHLDERHVPAIPFQRHMSFNQKVAYILSQDENLKYYLHLEQNRFPTFKRTSSQTSCSSSKSSHTIDEKEQMVENESESKAIQQHRLERLEQGFFNYALDRTIHVDQQLKTRTGGKERENSLTQEESTSPRFNHEPSSMFRPPKKDDSKDSIEDNLSELRIKEPEITDSSDSQEGFFTPTRGSPLKAIETENIVDSPVQLNLEEEEALEQARQIIHAVMDDQDELEATEQKRQTTEILSDERDSGKQVPSMSSEDGKTNRKDRVFSDEGNPGSSKASDGQNYIILNGKMIALMKSVEPNERSTSPFEAISLDVSQHQIIPPVDRLRHLQSPPMARSLSNTSSMTSSPFEPISVSEINDDISSTSSSSSFEDVSFFMSEN